MVCASIDVPVATILISIPMFARSVGLNVANIGTLAIPNARDATWCESRQQPLGRYRARSFHQPWDSTMKKPLAVAVVRYRLHRHVSLLRSAREMQPWGLCQELPFWGRSELWPAR